MKRLRLGASDPVGWPDHLAGAALACAYVGWLLATARSLGFPRDEGVYFRAGISYINWWLSLVEKGHRALTPAAINGTWSMNAEHPALMKTLFGLSWWLFHEKIHLFSDASTALRLPAMCMAGASLWITYLFGARAYSRRAGVCAAVLLGLMPNVFFHSHLACFDVPIMTMWLACIYVYWRALTQGGIAWTIAAGVAFGLALETKHNAWMLPAVFVPHALFVAVAHHRALPRGLRLGRIPVPWSLLSMATIGPAVFYALWPRLWTDTLANLRWYVSFMLNHDYYTIEFLGKNYFGPPSPKSYLPVMVIATVPTITLLLLAVGAAGRAAAAWARARAFWDRIASRRKAAPPGESSPSRASEASADVAETDLLVLLGMAVAVGPFFLETTPIFGGTKHWLTAYPFVTLVAGKGFDVVASRLSLLTQALPSGARLGAQAALVASVFLAPFAETAHSHPFGLSTYVPLVGGTAGGADLGLNRQFWGFTTQTAAENYLNVRAPRSSA
ncbi:MAG: glycosyltransferase family 39 protein, partial [Polyangiaceae bacterium]|nr:glycosyltransferase family 39 protein [Polyangiaceae bacterium]